MLRLLTALLLTALCLAQDEPPIMTLDSLADVYYEQESGNAIVSDEIKALNGKTVRIAGYMVPFNDLENLKEFMLMPSSNGCNFCEAPMKEEMVYVRQPGKKKYKFIGDPLVLTGKLWVQGAGTPAPNSTYAQFLYALEDTKVETLKAEQHALLQVVTPRTIIKQVCSLLRVRLLKQVKFVPLSAEDYHLQRAELLLKYIGGESGLTNLKLLADTFDVEDGDKILEIGSNYLAKWSAAYSDPSGETIYYLQDLDLSQPENQLQIAIACYDLLFNQEIGLHDVIHKGEPSYDEHLARLSLVLGLRQSFSQFYGSIGLIDMRPMEEFAKPFTPTKELPKAYAQLAQQILLNQKPLIDEIYKTEKFKPYTNALSAPPIAMAQVLKPSLYCGSSKFESPALDGHDNRLGLYLTSLLTQISPDELGPIRDGITFTEDGFNWTLELATEAKAKSLITKLEAFKKLAPKQKGRTLTLSPKIKSE